MKKIMASMVLGLFLISLVAAAVNYTDTQLDEIKSQFQTNAEQQAELTRKLTNATTEERMQLLAEIKGIREDRQEIRTEVKQNIRARIEEGKELILEEKKLRVRMINGKALELTTETGKKIRTEFNLTDDDANASRLKVQLSNGRNALIKIMPETASLRALERLRLKNCNEERNCTIELKEVGNGSATRAIYEAKAQKQFRIFGLFKNKEMVTTQIDAETGEEIMTKRPWWAWMASEEEEL